MFSSFSSPYSVSPIIEQGLVSGSCSLFFYDTLKLTIPTMSAYNGEQARAAA